MSDEVWGYGADEEHFSGDFSSREDAVQEGREMYNGESFYVAKGIRCTSSEFTPSPDTWLYEQMGEAAYEVVGDVAEGFPEVSTEAEKELTELLKAWADKHIKCSFWRCEEIELIEEEDELAST